MLRWEQRDLAEVSAVSLPTVKRLESQPGNLAAQASTVTALVKALEGAGVEFTNGERPGVRLAPEVAARVARGEAPSSKGASAQNRPKKKR